MALFLGSHGSHSARQWLYWKLEFHIIYHSPQVDLEAQIYGYKLIVGLWVAKKVCVAFDIYNTCIITICNAGYFRVVCIFKKLWNQLMIHKHSSQTWVRNWHQTKITTHWSVALIIDQPSQYITKLSCIHFHRSMSWKRPREILSSQMFSSWRHGWADGWGSRFNFQCFGDSLSALAMPRRTLWSRVWTKMWMR